MTTPSPAIVAPWDEVRLREVLRSHKPFTPRHRAVFERLHDCTRAYYQVQAEYAFETATQGAPNASLLRRSIRRLAKARRDALIAIGEDPATSNLLPALPTLPHDA